MSDLFSVTAAHKEADKTDSNHQEGFGETGVHAERAQGPGHKHDRIQNTTRNLDDLCERWNDEHAVRQSRTSKVIVAPHPE